MLEVLSGLLNASVLIFAVASMLSVGLGHTVRDIVEPLQHTREVMKALIANFVFVPILGYFVVQFFSIEKSLAAGLILIAFAAGAPFLIKLTLVAGSDVVLSTSLLVLLLPLTIIYMPLMVPVAIPEATVSAGSIAIPLILTMLLPLAIGFLIKAYFPPGAKRIQPFFTVLSSIALLLLIFLTLIVHFKAFTGMFGEGVIYAAFLIILGAFVIGYWLGGFGIHGKIVLGLGTSQRNIAAASVVANQGFEDRDTFIVVILTSVLGMLILFPISRILKKQVEMKFPGK